MNDINSQRGEETARQHFDPTTARNAAGGDRRDDGGLFPYQGPERRSGGDRRRSS